MLTKNHFVMKSFAVFLAVLLCLNGSMFRFSAAAPAFSDVPSDHWASPYINSLRELGITNGVGDNRFGMGQTITRAEFVTFVCKLLGWEPMASAQSRFTDSENGGMWYFPYINAAVYHGAVKEDTPAFRPDEPITREEMAVMLVRSLGYDELAQRLSYLGSPFYDVSQYTGYISIAKDLGIISGVGGGRFMPKATATREQAATMMIRMYEGLHRDIAYKNTFYAINSARQIQAITGFDSVSFGWARLVIKDGGVTLHYTTADGNEYYLPPGYETAYQAAGGKTRMLMAAVSNEEAAQILLSPDLQRQAASLMAGALDGIGGSPAFDGIVVDFEGLKGEALKNGLNSFLSSLKQQLQGKAMYVAVHPQRRAGHAYYDAYDYRAIGALADKVILMAHDYNARQLTPAEMEQGIVMTPIAPIEEIYYALRAITDPDTGIEDRGKILLQLSFGSAQWKLQDGKVINGQPYTPGYDAIAARISQASDIKYNTLYESPYITFYNDSDSTNNIVWYEDQRSVAAKIKLAKLFGITGLSVWRLGTIPNDAPSIYFDVLGDLLKP